MYYVFNNTAATETSPYAHSLSVHDALPFSTLALFLVLLLFGPFALRRGAQTRWGEAAECLSGAQHREFRPRPLCRAPQGTAAWQQRRAKGVFSLGYFSLDKQREVTRPWGENTSRANGERSEEHTSELQSLMRISYAGFCL